MSRIRTIVVEDQLASREHLVASLNAEPDVEVVAACAAGRDAIDAIRSNRPDLVFLDLDLPDLDGFRVIEEVGPAAMPPTIFVTAFDEFAVRAFEFHAFDYLLKPFGRERLRQALERARHYLGAEREGELARRLMALVHDARPTRQAETGRFLVKAGGRILFVPFSEIDYVEADGNYVRLHAGPRSHVIRETMQSVEKRLASQRFARVHRSRIVNLDRATELRARGNGEYELVLQNGSSFRVGRAFRDALQQRLKSGN
jgi:two-component system, LytTR family, response regulator